MTNTDKTTYQDLSTSSIAGVSALLDAPSPAHKADLQQRLNDAIRLSTPAAGQYWPGQGGIYAGIVRDGDRQWHLILCCETREPQTIAATFAYIPEDCAFKGTWGNYGHTVEGEFSRVDGQHNTQLILASEPDNYLANAIATFTIEGHTDCYWPSQCENNLIFTNLPEHLTPEWHWSSTQYSAGSAWMQDFEDGGASIDGKDDKRAVRAVRRLPIE